VKRRDGERSSLTPRSDRSTARVSGGARSVLLAVCAPEVAGRRLVIEGRRVQAVPFGRLALLLSFVAQSAYSARGDRARALSRRG
jgi:hypothetical protein